MQVDNDGWAPANKMPLGSTAGYMSRLIPHKLTAGLAMLLFATEIPVDPTRTISDFMMLCRKWLVGSPHSKIADVELPTPETGEVLSVELSGDTGTVTAGRADAADAEIGGTRFENEDRDGRWSAEVVGHRRANVAEFLVGVQVHWFAGIVPRTGPPKVRRPHIIKQIIEEFGAAPDGDLPIQTRPHYVDNDCVEFVAAHLNASTTRRLPLVWLSADSMDQPCVDANRLAFQLAGIAHVLVEPTRSFSFRLRDRVLGGNAYAGVVGVHWPGLSFGRRFAPRGGSASAQFPNLELVREIVDYIESARSTQQPSNEATWAHLQEAVAASAVARLRREGSRNLDEYSAAFDQENAALKVQNSELRSEMQRLRAQMKSERELNDRGALLADGKERDIYTGERRSLLVAVLREALRSLGEGSRRQHIVRDVIDANCASMPSEDHDRDLVKALKGFTAITRVRRELEHLGFDVTEDGKHAKLVFGGDERYSFTIGKTPSDQRAGLNSAKFIAKSLF